jgi:glutamate synthase domain-containing protein 1
MPDPSAAPSQGSDVVGRRRVEDINQKEGKAMTQSNGSDVNAMNAAEETAIVDEIKAMAGQIRERGITVVERVAEDGSGPFEQKSHDLMNASVDRITQQWVDELGRVRDNTKVVEQMVITQAAKVKDELTRLHLLGVQAMREAQRGHEVSQHLAEELDAMMADTTTH